MFPNQENILQNNINDNETTIIGKSFLFDFKKGDFVLDGTGNLKPLSNFEALKIWIEKILKTDRNKFIIYEGSNYGIDSLKELVNSDYNFEFIKAEIEINIKDVLLQNTAIKSVEDFKFERDKRQLLVSFNISTIYGVVNSEVNI